MKKCIKKIIYIFVIMVCFICIIDKIPFSEKINRTVEAAVYKDGLIIDETSVCTNGEKTKYLFKPNNFVGEFRIPYAEKTDIDELQAEIDWNKNSNLQSVNYFYKGNFLTSDKYGIVQYLLISENMKDFALMTTDNEVIATSEEMYKLYKEHISYDKINNTTTVLGENKIPKL